MIRLLGLGIAGFCSVPFWPPDWRLGLSLGWGAALLLELALFWRGGTVLERGRPNLLGLAALGFLGKLAVLVAGGLLAGATGAYSPACFLVAFAAAAFVLHLVAVHALLQRQRAARKLPPTASAC